MMSISCATIGLHMLDNSSSSPKLVSQSHRQQIQASNAQFDVRSCNLFRRAHDVYTSRFTLAICRHGSYGIECHILYCAHMRAVTMTEVFVCAGPTTLGLRGGGGTTPCIFATPFFSMRFFGNASVYLSASHFHIFWCKISEKMCAFVNLYTKREVQRGRGGGLVFTTISRSQLL